jgi:hypothetical protein
MTGTVWPPSVIFAMYSTSCVLAMGTLVFPIMFARRWRLLEGLLTVRTWKGNLIALTGHASKRAKMKESEIKGPERMRFFTGKTMYVSSQSRHSHSFSKPVYNSGAESVLN